jgi:hypothetical protein
MTRRKSDIAPRGDRPPTFVDRIAGSAELCISPATWDQWVKAGLLPAPTRMGIAGETTRWDWAQCKAWLADPALRSIESKPAEPFFRGLVNGQTKERKRAAS